MTASDLLADLLVVANRYIKLISKYDAGECTTSEMYEIIPLFNEIILMLIRINIRVSRATPIFTAMSTASIISSFIRTLTLGLSLGIMVHLMASM